MTDSLLLSQHHIPCSINIFSSCLDSFVMPAGSSEAQSHASLGCLPGRLRAALRPPARLPNPCLRFLGARSDQHVGGHPQIWHGTQRHQRGAVPQRRHQKASVHSHHRVEWRSVHLTRQVPLSQLVARSLESSQGLSVDVFSVVASCIDQETSSHA